MDGKEWGGHLLRKCSRAKKSREDVDLQKSDINSGHDGVVGRGMGSDHMISRKWLVSLIYEGRDLTINWR